MDSRQWGVQGKATERVVAGLLHGLDQAVQAGLGSL